MAVLHVRNVPEELYNRLKQRAKAQRRPLSAEVIWLLERALQETERDPAAVLTRIRTRRSFNPASVGAPDSTTILRQDRER